MPRLNKDRQDKLEPIRLKKAIEELNKIGIKAFIRCSISICFDYKNENVIYYPYSGWATGKSIKDGRGLNNLLKQLNNNNNKNN